MPITSKNRMGLLWVWQKLWVYFSKLWAWMLTNETIRDRMRPSFTPGFTGVLQDFPYFIAGNRVRQILRTHPSEAEGYWFESSRG